MDHILIVKNVFVTIHSNLTPNVGLWGEKKVLWGSSSRVSRWNYIVWQLSNLSFKSWGVCWLGTWIKKCQVVVSLRKKTVVTIWKVGRSIKGLLF